ncbi:MAG: hypothetical protein ACREMU_02620 [Gemmatimonadaceae bacterium]
MRLRGQFTLVGSFVLAAVAAACGSDSTAPRAANFALHFDSLYGDLLADHTVGQATRLFYLSDIEIATAYGAIPRDVSVTTASGVERWHAVEFMLNPNGDEFTFHHELLVYRENDAHTVLEVNFDSSGSATIVTLIQQDTLPEIVLDVTGSSVVRSQHAGCPKPPALSNALIADYALAECATALFSDSFSANIPSDPGLDPALTHLEFGPTVVAGEIFVSPFGDFSERH